MAFSDAAISDPRQLIDGFEWILTWASTAPSGTPYQIYINGVLTWWGLTRRAILPMPSGPSSVRIGTVAIGEETTDFSASIAAPVGGGRRIEVEWYGGDFEGDDIDGFNIYMSSVAGGSIDWTKPVDRMLAYPLGLLLDGAGFGPAGIGGAGRAASTYQWTTPGPLAGGVWLVGVKPVDHAGNLGPSLTWSGTIVAPPNAPTNLRGSFNPTTRVESLTWTPG